MKLSVSKVAFFCMTFGTNVIAQNSVNVGPHEMDECVQKSVVRIEPLQDDIEGIGRLAVLSCDPLWTEISRTMSDDLKKDLQVNYIQQATRAAISARIHRVEGN